MRSLTQNELCDLLEIPRSGGAAFTVSSVTEDSRRLRPGAVFVVSSGAHADGHDFAPQAAAAGAAAIVGGRDGLTELCGLPYLRAADPHVAAGRIAHALAGDPTSRLCVLGVTGTNGKGGVAHLVQAVLNHAGRSCANFGTIGYDIGGVLHSAPHTTPFAEDLADMFARAECAGHTHVVMEVSSIALDQERVAGVHFAAAGFTNLTRDHLDYHGDMDSYLAAKLKLFRRIEPSADMQNDPRFIVVNAEDPAAPHFIDASRVPCHRFGCGGDVRAEKARLDFSGATFRLATPFGTADAHIRLLGHHNVSNALCAAAFCTGLGVPVDTVAAGLGTLASVAGRFDPVDAGQPFYVIVDYAHTDDGLLNVLRAARALCKGRIITVFGCGGDRDKGKRPKMGAIAASMSDFCILTSDNPRTEDPHRILLDVEVGMQRTDKRKGDDYLVIESREQAIRKAVSLAKPGDLVMIAGKGHENYQIIGTERRHFDDREEAMAALKALKP